MVLADLVKKIVDQHYVELETEEEMELALELEAEGLVRIYDDNWAKAYTRKTYDLMAEAVLDE